MEKKPFVSREKLEEIASVIPTPFHIYDEAGLRRNIRDVKKAFAWNKGFREYFAVKAEPNPVILSILKEEGCGCDCSSMTELMMAKAIGCTGELTMFSSNDTPPEEYVYANDMGAIINLDDFTMVDKFEKAVGKFPKTMCCRYNPGGIFKVSNDIMDNPGDAKYGMTTDQLFRAFWILKEKGVENFGIHSFLVSNAVTNHYYPMRAKLLFELAVALKKEVGVHISFINLSGGIGIPYRPGQEPNDIFAIGEGVRTAYEDVLVPAGMGDVALYTEMGRYVTGPFGA
ncbi:MAG: diaminopimelate decarboxylase, partial [Lachnospiraceae bacterium]|nr:diaminopimelate decarboxylase [Lachnospiraceae bacterium]